MLRQKMLNLFESIKARKLEELIMDMKEPIEDQKFADLEYEYSVKISPEVRSVYNSFNGLRVKWQYHSEKIEEKFGYLEGSIRILNFQDMMIGFDGRTWKDEIWLEQMEETQLNFFQRLKPFDYYATDTVRCVCLEIDASRRLTPNLWLYNQGSYPLRMNIGLVEYFQLLEKVKGAWGWQFFYTNIDLSNENNKIIRENCEFIIDCFGQVFDNKFEIELKQIFQRLINR